MTAVRCIYVEFDSNTSGPNRSIKDWLVIDDDDDEDEDDDNYYDYDEYDEDSYMFRPFFLTIYHTEGSYAPNWQLPVAI